MPINAEDLPPKLRKQIEELDKKKGNGKSRPAQSQGKGKRRPKPSRAGVGLAEGGPGTCGTCGLEFDTPAKWERHADETGCSRWDVDLAALQQPPDTNPSTG